MNQIENGLGMRFAFISSGKFQMGSAESEGGRHDDELRHEVHLTKWFYLSVHSVTQDQWHRLMGTKPWRGKKHVREGVKYPATYVTWNDAVEFCQKLTERERVEHRLPTEAEWEYACRAGATTAYSFGDNASSLNDYGWYDENTWELRNKYAHTVGKKRPNSWGLYDMHGNVWEWCADWYGEYASGLVTGPSGPAEGEYRVARGGSWDDSAYTCRSALRVRDDPADCSSGLGFRVARRSAR